jgi:ribosomal protein S27E
MENASELLMLQGVWAQCADCGSEQVFLPIAAGEFCCTGCDAAVFLLEVHESTGGASGATRHVA